MADPGVILDLIDAFRRSKAMFTAATLGVFDRTPATLSELARQLDVNPDALERLLDACVGLGLLTRRERCYANTEVADQYLRRSSPDTLLGYVTYSDRILYPLWGNLAGAVREGSHRWRQTFGLDGPIFEHFFRTPEAREEFFLGMHGLGKLSSPKVVRAFDLSGYQKLVDLGGGTGHLVMAAADRYPGLKVAVFDLPPAIETAKHFVDHRVELLAGDFFTDPLPPADLYALGRILHDWSESKIRRLLQKIYASLPAGGALLVVERLLDPDKAGPLPALMQSLNMLCCTEGKERTLKEYEEMLRYAGFDSVQGAVTGTVLDAILACKS
ncbi:MAG: acetylserotonin O-methyltransferase [Bryobacteraceae bacterium]|nr:acetylserotonin O-methyltransferase [Bryobacteraceae bacterium]MDW8380113.1 class I SAM-dependent methyltransferase [Bryobacterales bacterium]